MQKFTSLEKLLLFCLLLIPFGTAVHNAVLGIFVISAIVLIARRRQPAPKLSLQDTWPLVAAFLMIIWTIITAHLNPKNQFQAYLPYIAGYAPLFLLPYLCRWSAINAKKVFSYFERLIPTMMGLWFLVSASQSIWGWSMMRAMGEWQNFRPHGFYSHPLSLAYAALLFWPYSLWRLMKNHRSPAAWLLAASNFGIIFLTNSRTCLAVAALAVFWVILRSLRGRHLVIAGALAFVSLLTISLTDNPVSRKMILTMQAQDPDRFSHYPDDRLAFWDAHREMIIERPLLGHGAHLDTAYRTPYYEQLGLADFNKKYNAHNQFIQVMANGGVIGLASFASIFAGLFYLLGSRIKDPFHRAWMGLSLFVFLLASITQNAFDDAVVRYSLVMIVCWLYSLLPIKPGSHKPGLN
ncbi:MAG: O-antigen ligase family protein [Oligoflexus sp.]